MANSRSSSRRSAYTLLFVFAVISLVLFTRWPSDSKRSKQGVKVISKADGLVTHVRESGTEGLGISQELLSGDVIMPKLGNETAKYAGVPLSVQKRDSLTGCTRAELGRAAWKLFHTTFARFPEKPTEDQKATLRAWTHLFQRMYPW